MIFLFLFLPKPSSSSHLPFLTFFRLPQSPRFLPPPPISSSFSLLRSLPLPPYSLSFPLPTPLLPCRASKEFGIPNSTLYKIARKEGIKLSSPFSAIQPSWNPDDLTKALEAIRGGMSVQKAAQEFGIPTGTLYGRCRREGIELSKYQVS